MSSEFQFASNSRFEKPFFIHDKSGMIFLMGNARENKVIYENTDSVELIKKCQDGKSYVQVCKCPGCDDVEKYYCHELVSIRVAEEGESDWCTWCEEDVEWKILATVKMVEVAN